MLCDHDQATMSVREGGVGIWVLVADLGAMKPGNEAQG